MSPFLPPFAEQSLDGNQFAAIVREQLLVRIEQPDPAHRPVAGHGSCHGTAAGVRSAGYLMISTSAPLVTASSAMVRTSAVTASER